MEWCGRCKYPCTHIRTPLTATTSPRCLRPLGPVQHVQAHLSSWFGGDVYWSAGALSENWSQSWRVWRTYSIPDSMVMTFLRNAKVSTEEPCKLPICNDMVAEEQKASPRNELTSTSWAEKFHVRALQYPLCIIPSQFQATHAPYPPHSPSKFITS